MLTVGLSSTSFCRIANAVRHSVSASAGLPVCNSADAEVHGGIRKTARKSAMTAVSSSASFW